MEQLVTSEFKLGIVAGGQLGKMLVLAANNWDVKTYVMDKEEQCPASGSCTLFVRGDPNNYDDLLRFGRMVDMLTFEIEIVSVDALKQLASEGKRINPSPEILEMIQDKGLQKEFYESHNIPSAPFQLVNDKDQIMKLLESGKLHFPFVQKLRKGGYDGRGVAVITGNSDLNKLLDGPSVIEKKVEISKEISVIAARNANGEVKYYPVVEMEFNPEANLVERLVCPAAVTEEVSRRAQELASKLVSDLGVCGILAVEFFIDQYGDVLVNEVAPRPHNSGHHTIESIMTSQFEQMLRAIFNFPLGSTQSKLPAVMINLLGEPGHTGPVKYEGLSETLKIDGVKVHLYGKKITQPFRKMGHVTVLDSSIDAAREKAELVKQNLKIKSWQNQL